MREGARVYNNNCPCVLRASNATKGVSSSSSRPSCHHNTCRLNIKKKQRLTEDANRVTSDPGVFNENECSRATHSGGASARACASFFFFFVATRVRKKARKKKSHLFCTEYVIFRCNKCSDGAARPCFTAPTISSDVGEQHGQGTQIHHQMR